MANSTGGFGQVLPQAQGHKRRNSRNGSLDDRLNWSSRSDAASSSHRSARHHQQRISMDYNSSQRQPSQYDMASDTYSTSAASSAQLAPLQQKPPKRFRLSTNASTATDSENNFPLVRHPPPQPHSTTSSADALSPDTAALDPSLIPSPSQQTPPIQRMGSSPSVPTLNPVPGFYALQNQSPIPFTSSNLQGMDFLQSLSNQPGGDLDADFGGGGGGGGQDTQMDLNFGLGWEGLHHDFSDGQQLDLFDGFFFGDQRGAGGGNGMGLSMALDQAAAGMQLKGEDMADAGDGERAGQGQ
jgi:hypothetical protein